MAATIDKRMLHLLHGSFSIVAFTLLHGSICLLWKITHLEQRNPETEENAVDRMNLLSFLEVDCISMSLADQLTPHTARSYAPVPFFQLL